MRWSRNLINKLIKNLKNSVAGLKIAFFDESFRLEIFFGVLLAPLIALSGAHELWKYAAIAAYLILLSIEILNTAIERLCDRVTKEHDEDIKAVKDMASAAVFMAIVLLAFVTCKLAWHLWF